MRIFDSHLHLFSKMIIENVAAKVEMCDQLHLRTGGAAFRRDLEGMEDSMKAAGVAGGLALPTAGAANVAKVNSQFIEKASKRDFLYTAGTLHPDYPGNRAELEKLKSHGIRAIKLCSFSQGFALDGPPALALFDQIQTFNRTCNHRFFVVLDTLYTAPRYFGADPAYATTPAKLVALARKFPAHPFHRRPHGQPGRPVRRNRVQFDPLRQPLPGYFQCSPHPDAGAVRHPPEQVRTGTDPVRYGLALVSPPG